MIAKRLFDLVSAIAGLVVLGPLFVIIAAAIKATSKGPVFFQQERVGRHGRPFRIIKFRTMRVGGEVHGQLTIGADPRVTGVGAFLRKYRIDEFPQLLNVLKGEMSFVGPRPEVPKYVALYPVRAREVILSVRPGVTDKAAIEFRNEASLLATAPDPERVYIEQVLPAKVRYHLEYVEKRSFGGDLLLMLRTVVAVLRPQ
jgi:lipopolysaccharide/colanic/teichoic acid biosynthesis glycosyltransferase